MLKFRLLVVVALISARILCAETSKEAFYIQASRMVVRIDQDLGNGTVKLLGTGFFVQDEKGQLYIVSARHVVDCHCDLRARVPALVKATRKTEVIEVHLPSARWVFSASEGDQHTMNVDVAVMRLPDTKDRAIVTFRYCKQDCPKDEYNQLAADPVPPDQIVILGFPLDIG